MKPVIALIGRPNVGKSTLFNQITKSRDALVADFAGLTRDRKYGDAVFQNKSFIVVDTGVLAKMKVVLIHTWQNSQKLQSMKPILLYLL